MFQQINLLDEMSVLDNAMVAGLLVDSSRAGVRGRAADLFARVGIDASTQRQFPSTLSGGEAQRAAVVRALMNRPNALFADEPTGQLNSASSTAVLDLMSSLAADGQTTIMVTHDPGSALRADRVLYLLDGSIAGVLDLPPYAGPDETRRARLVDFLSSMGW